MTSKFENIQTLKIKDCEILNIATGVRAQNLEELREAINQIGPESLYHHFWAKKLRPGFEQSEFNNDFASWAYEKLHDTKLAERLSLINPGMLSNIEDLRSNLVEVIEKTLKENNSVEKSKESEKFQFTESQIVLFDTEHEISKPEELTELIPSLSKGSIYYHFIESKNGPENIKTFITKSGDKYVELANELSDVDPYFFTLSELQSKVTQIFKNFFNGAAK